VVVHVKITLLTESLVIVLLVYSFWQLFCRDFNIHCVQKSEKICPFCFLHSYSKNYTTESSDDETQRSRITIVYATSFEIFIHILLTVLKAVQENKCF